MRAEPAAPIRLTPGEIADYYRARVPGLKKKPGGEWHAPCPIHQGKGLNFSVNPETGQWFCHSQCGRGGDIFDLEEALHGGDFPTRKAEIFRLIGRGKPTKPAKPVQGGWHEEVRYAYTDENGGVLYEVVRYREKKRRRRCRSSWRRTSCRSSEPPRRGNPTPSGFTKTVSRA